MAEVPMPTFDSMMNPLIEALKNLGGSGTIEEIYSEVVDILELPTEVLEALHNPEKGSQTEVEYRLAWTRTYLKKYGLLENSSRGVWALTPAGRNVEWVDEREVVKYVRDLDRQSKLTQVDDSEEPDAAASWQDELMGVLLQMEPSAFERLFQRILRESGFVQVEVLGRSGDGGIDGTGIIRIGGLLSFRALFQCKRWQSSVGASVIRDFRGAMVGRADKGLLVTTSSFTNEARAEATRDGAPAIDLIDGDQLVKKLKELELGVRTEKVVVEKVLIDRDWFMSI